ncbi:Aminotransferase-like mobile domain containing protein [Parasponia andersonii]|uniref:Aminotransferase-like mobile domain containing protein n=1 Tax=Parasponia andersonii TaxID=3476 RepID=A0A2P5BRV9_PARAD|nr:Aminotransferase-like mobile domain containing protein [Parasponia andersonii]
MEDSIVEAREEFMVSPTGKNPTLKTAHFLKPTVTSIKDPSFNLPQATLRPSSTTVAKPGSLPFDVAFNGWLFPQENWKTWVERLSSKHQLTWKKAGIFDAIMGSTYKINKYPDVVLELGKKWCPETNTFVFRWAEATLTLEDMMRCGGYSVLGCRVFGPPETFLGLLEASKVKAIEEKLNKARLDFVRSKARKACQHAWMKHFMEQESDLEHEAFLSIWLSRFVFPGLSRTTVLKQLFPLAIRLARGTRVALAPAVLATIYRDLTLLKGKMVALSESEREVTLWAPFQLVLVWAWERFLNLRPERNLVQVGEPRLAQWHKVKKPEYGNLQSALDSSGEYFSWRPYATEMDNNCVQSKFYREKSEWICVTPDFDEELESFARCLRPSELMGIEFGDSGHCIEQYLPHRVARQFGLDQDLPGNVVRSNTIAWRNYNKPISLGELYIPSRFSSPEVTLRYFNWWNGTILGGKDQVESVGRQNNLREDREATSCPPGFSPKCDDVKGLESDREDKLTIKEMFNSLEIDENANGEILRDGNPLLGIANEEMEHLNEPVEEVVQNAVGTGVETTTEDKKESEEEEKVNENGGESKLRSAYDLDAVKALEARVGKLENLIAEIRAARGNGLIAANKWKKLKNMTNSR